MSRSAEQDAPDPEESQIIRVKNVTEGTRRVSIMDMTIYPGTEDTRTSEQKQQDLEATLAAVRSAGRTKVLRGTRGGKNRAHNSKPYER